MLEIEEEAAEEEVEAAESLVPGRVNCQCLMNALYGFGALTVAP